MPNEEGLYTPEEWSGLLTDKQNEVRNRQQTQTELAITKAEVNSLTEKIKALEALPKQEVIENPDNVVTRAEMIAELKKQKKELLEEHEQDKKKMTQKEKEEAVDNSFLKAKEKMTEAKMGKGLDFDSVWEATQRQIKDNPGYKAVILNDRNPGEKAYEIGLLDPIIAKRVALDKKNFPDQKRIPKVGLESTETPSNYFSQKRVHEMSQPEIEANLPAIRESQKSWKKEDKM